jgi:FkbM family methyltransferase
VIRTVSNRLRSLVRYAGIMQTPRDMLVYGWLRATRSAGGTRPLAIRVRSLGGTAVLCRSSTADVFTFKAAFLKQFHLPPIALPDEPVILDLGSNIGLTVAHLAHTFPRARVIGVEMDAANLALARANTAAFGDRVRLVHAAVWTSDGAISYGGDRSDGFQVSGPAAEGAAGELTSRALRVDTLLDESGIAVADYVKMDIEGAEAAVLDGAPAWLDRVRSLKVEVHAPATVDSVSRALRARGFRCWTDAEHWSCVCAVRDEATSPAEHRSGPS